MAEHSTKDDVRYLEGKIAGLQFVCGAIISHFATTDALRESFMDLFADLSAHVNPTSNPQFRTGLENCLKEMTAKIIRDH